MDKHIEVPISDLAGAALDWAVAVACDEEPMHIRDSEPRLWNEDHSFGYSPSTDWAQGGPLIEKHKVATIEMGEPLEWYALIGISFDIGNNLCGEVEATGQTPLIAGVRAICAAKLGPTVSVPSELVGGDE